MWDVIVLIPDHCLSICLSLQVVMCKDFIKITCILNSIVIYKTLNFQIYFTKKYYHFGRRYPKNFCTA